MDNLTPTIDEVYREYAGLLLRHHELLSEGPKETAEVAEVEDELTATWERLDSVQRASLSGLASDLNWVRRGGAPAPRGRRPEDVSDDDIRGLAQAEGAADWHGLLYFLRVCAPRTPNPALARLRARAWDKLGLRPVAGVFAAFLRSLDSANADAH